MPSIEWIGPARQAIDGASTARLAVALSTGLLTLALASLATKARSTESAMAWCILGGPIAGIVDAGVSLGAVLFLKSGDPGEALGGLVLGHLVGGFFGAPLGLLYGLALALLVRPAVIARDRPSHDALDRTAAIAGAWLFAVGAASLLLAEGLADRERAAATVTETGGGVLSAGGLPVLAVAAGAAGDGRVPRPRARARPRARRRCEAEVRRGARAGWVVVDRAAAGECRGLLPLRRASDAPCAGVLARCAPAGETAYRSARRIEPVALIASGSG